MDHEMVITQKDLDTRFQGERDLVTYAPYQIGDRVVRCSACHCVVKTEFITNQCPLCGHAPFVPVPVVAPEDDAPVRNQRRDRSDFFWMLMVSAGLSLVPYFIFEGSSFMQEVTFGAAPDQVLLYGSLTALIVALIVYCSAGKSWEKREGSGFVLLPAISPYLLLAGIWALIALSAVLLTIGIIVMGIMLIASFVSNL